MRFLETLAAREPGADLNHDGLLDSRDLYLFTVRWSQVSLPIPAISDLTWTPQRGDWQFNPEAIQGSSDLDARLVSNLSLPLSLDVLVELHLEAGASAGLLYWADSSGQTGFTVRYDDSLHALVLSRVGPWPEEEQLDLFPWSLLDGNPIRLRVVSSPYAIRAYREGDSRYPVLTAKNVTPMGNHIGFYVQDARAEFRLLDLQSAIPDEAPDYVPVAGAFQPIFDQSVGEGRPWYINDHNFIHGVDGLWHLFGTTNTADPIQPQDEDQFAHATSPSLTQSPWEKHPFALRTDLTAGESLLWSPHVIEKDGMYYMFYTAGSQYNDYEFRFHLATSPDLFNWTRYANNPLFQDYYDARDPMVFFLDGEYLLYYTANDARPSGHYIVAYRTSNDLLHWSPRHVAFTHDQVGTYAGPTESPFVVRYGESFYLFIGPESRNVDPLADYQRTVVYRSANPYYWNRLNRITEIEAHAPEIIQDTDGQWYLSRAGWYFSGVSLAPLDWQPEPQVRVFIDLGETSDFVMDHNETFVSDWRGAGGLGFLADGNAEFTLEIPLPAGISEGRLEFEEEGETHLERLNGGERILLLDEGNTGPGTTTLHRYSLSIMTSDSPLRLNFRDSDPSDGWGPNVNWLRLLW